MQKIPAQRVINCTVPAGAAKGSNILFPIDKFLTGRKVIGVETLNADQQAVSSTGVQVVTPADAVNITLTLVAGSTELHKAIPLPSLNTIQLSGLFKTLPPTVIDWNASYVTLNATPTVGSAFVVPVIVHYI